MQKRDHKICPGGQRSAMAEKFYTPGKHRYVVVNWQKYKFKQ